jgi:hypothetical protein
MKFGIESISCDSRKQTLRKTNLFFILKELKEKGWGYGSRGRAAASQG